MQTTPTQSVTRPLPSATDHGLTLEILMPNFLVSSRMTPNEKAEVGLPAGKEQFLQIYVKLELPDPSELSCAISTFPINWTCGE